MNKTPFNGKSAPKSARERRGKSLGFFIVRYLRSDLGCLFLMRRMRRPHHDGGSRPNMTNTF